MGVCKNTNTLAYSARPTHIRSHGRGTHLPWTFSAEIILNAYKKEEKRRGERSAEVGAICGGWLYWCFWWVVFCGYECGWVGCREVRRGLVAAPVIWGG